VNFSKKIADSMNFDNITIGTLGLERSIWETISKKEQTLYNFTVTFFFIFLFILLNANVCLFYLITSSLLAAAPCGFILTLIWGNIIRFILIINRSSIYDQDDIISKSYNETLRTKKRTILSSIWDSKFWVPFVVLFFIGLVTCYSLTCELNFSKVEDINSQKRKEFSQKFISTIQAEDQREIARMRNEKVSSDKIEHVLNEHKTPNSSSQLLIQDSTEIEKSYQISKQNILSIEAKRISDFSSEIENQYFLVPTFSFISRLLSFKIILYFLTFLLATPYWILLILKKHNYFNYSSLSANYYRKIIDQEYFNTNQKVSKSLKTQFDFTPRNLTNHLKWKNPPYNTIPNRSLVVNKLLDKKAFNDILLKNLEQ